MEAIVALAFVASFCIYTSGILVAIVASIVDALIDILALPLPRGSKKSFLTHAQTIGTFGIFPKNDTTFRIRRTNVWTWGCLLRLLHNCLGGK